MDSSTVARIRLIVERHFNEEIEYKKTEVELISERIHRTKQVLDKLRAAIISKYYAVPDFPEASASENCVHPSVRAYFAGKTLPSARLQTASSYDLPVRLGRGLLEGHKPVTAKTMVKSMEKVKFVIGNVSRYIGDEDPEDIVTHIWVTYVRLHPSEQLKIQDIVSKVRFFLHPSYVPHDVVDVTCPFQLKRKGWGEFSLRSQLHFVDPLNKPVDVIHALKLDKHKTGLQTFGGETVFEVMLLVEKETDSPKKKEEPASESQPPVSEVKGETADFEESDTEPADVVVKRESLRPPSPNIIDLEAHGHDYCTPMRSQPVPYILVAADSTDKIDMPQGVRTAKGESLLKPKYPLLDSLVPQWIAPWMETTADWDKCLKKVNFTQDVYKVIDILAQNHFTLVGHRSVSDLCYQVGSVDEFLSCHVGKRRAIEWFRASSLRRVLLKYGAVNVPKTRVLLLYLRKNGYTPLHGSTQCALTKLEEPSFDSYTFIDFSDKLSSVSYVSHPAKKSSEKLPDEEIYVDVESLETEEEDGPCPKLVTFALPHLQFVYEALEQMVGDDRLAEEPKELEALLQLVSSATMSFARQLLRRSLAEAFVRNSSNYEVDGILPVDVYRAIGAHDLFDFLGNGGLGELDSGA
ncbi:YEATS domain-containing protein 2-like [Tropilaelaps mercedesae]|uniref:YEATS domain-containing protein 2-like n=1 Tax=Tropilaelaps mercedesae TaxID=418985 RepID=A0A1V9XJR7_9ACAR|nr:YEATS domain-containing protein 2-like [Tropilaelaps mercedesae]